MNTISSPNYDRPPLVEVAISLQFPPMPKLNCAHLGAFWQLNREAYPTVQVAPLITTHVEEFGQKGQWLPPSMQIALNDTPELRVQLSSADSQWMVQLQPDRLVLNWREGSEEYPRFPAVLKRFKSTLDDWQAFLAGADINLPAPFQWELAYVNKIPSGELWHSPMGFPTALPGLWKEGFNHAEMLQMRGVRGQWVWDHASEPARVYVDAKPARYNRKGDTQDLLMLHLTARGSLCSDVESSGWKDDAETAIFLGHEMIVWQFDSIISETAKETWGRNV